jgi:type IV secretion system protein VirD4
LDKLLLGNRWNPKSGRTGKRVTYDLRSHQSMVAPTGAGKGVTVEIPNLLLGLRRMSVLSIDPSGQNAAVCAEARRRGGSDVKPLNPFNLHVTQYPDLRDIGFNPLLMLPDPSAPNFFEEAMALGDASISVEGDSQIHFPNSARGLMTWLMMFVRAARSGDAAHLGLVRDLLTSDLQAVANAAVATGHPRIKSLAHKYTQKLSNELTSVVSTAETQTRWLLSDPMRESLSSNGIDFGCLKDSCTTVFLILPAGTELENHGVWLRICVVSALNALYRRGGEGVPTLMMLSEFAQLGKVAPIKAAFGQARKYGVRLFPVLQNWGQLVEIYGRDGTGTFIANSGCIIGFNPGNDVETAEALSKMSDEHGEISINASDDPRAPGGVHIGISEQRERVWSPGRIRQLPDFHALVWKAGWSQPQPVVCLPYWKVRACRRLARPDPYHPDSGKPLSGLGRAAIRGVAAMALGLVVLTIGVLFL